MTLLEVLKEIKEKGPFCKEEGICYNIALKDKGEDRTLLIEGVKLVQKLTGKVYPIPYGFFKKWDRRTEIGKQRWTLLNNMINHLEKEKSNEI